MSDFTSRRCLIALSTLCEPGNLELAQLLESCGPEETLARLSGSGDETGLQRQVTARLDGTDPMRRVDTALAAAQRCGARVLTAEDPEWPAPVDDLAELFDESDPHTGPPICLWVRGPGRLAEVVTRSVSIVGARACTSYGRHVATELGYRLAAAEWSVVSGGAYGIDEAAHRGALAADGTTVAVLACGVDRPYPATNAALFDQIAQTGLLVSEWPPGAIPQRHRFLVRNRVIAALTPGTVVVEAALRSGARQTARRVWELDRQLLLVPGPVTSAASAGVHQLARGPGPVRLVTRAAEVMEDLGRVGADLAPPLRGADHERDRLDPLAAQVLDAVPLRGFAAAEQIAAQAGVSTTQVRRTLPGLLARGFVDGDRRGYRLTD